MRRGKRRPLIAARSNNFDRKIANLLHRRCCSADDNLRLVHLRNLRAECRENAKKKNASDPPARGGERFAICNREEGRQTIEWLGVN